LAVRNRYHAQRARSTTKRGSFGGTNAAGQSAGSPRAAKGAARALRRSRRRGCLAPAVVSLTWTSSESTRGRPSFLRMRALPLFLFRFSQSHARPLAVLLDEDHAGRFEGAPSPSAWRLVLASPLSVSASCSLIIFAPRRLGGRFRFVGAHGMRRCDETGIVTSGAPASRRPLNQGR